MHAIHHHAADERQNNHGQRKAQAEQAKPQQRVGQLQNEPALRDVLRPRPDVRRDQSRLKQDEISVLQSRKARRTCFCHAHASLSKYGRVA